jgi:pentose-5-phosphate-3-epimerase
MNPFFNMMNNPMMNLIKQVQQIKQNPNQLATLLQQRGMINEQQAKDIQKMGGNYEQIGQYLMNNGRMPTNVQQYQDQVNQVQNMMQNNQNQTFT